MIIYLHGLNSTAASGKARALVEYCGREGIPCAAPTLHHRPAEAMRQVGMYLADGKPHTLVGSSMGGYFATHLCERYPQLRAVLINPAVKLAEKIADLVGREQKNYHGGEDYVFSAAHLEEFAALETAGVSAPERYWLLVQKGDEVIDYREAVAFYDGARQTVEEGGDHSFVGFARHLPDIAAFAAEGEAGAGS